MSRVFRTALVGGGAGGTAMLIAASKAGLFPEIARDLVVVDRGPALGAGRLGRYAITSDSTAATFLSAVKDNPVPALAALIDHPTALALGGYLGDVGVPLAIVGRFFDEVGAVLHREIEAAGGRVITGRTVSAAQRLVDGRWRLAIAGGQGGIVAEQIVLATGGTQPLDRLAGAVVAGEPLVARCASRLVQSDEVLARGGIALVNERLAGRSPARIAIVGGSTSAVTAANRLLRHPQTPPLGRGGLTVLHRRPIRPFYHSAEAARAEGFDDFGADDICPISGFVYRFAGLRLDARDLLRRALGLTGEPDPRLRLHRITRGSDETALRILDDAHLVISALGYRPRALPLQSENGKPIALAADAEAPLVDAQCRIIRGDGEPVPDAYAIGLAAGFRPRGGLGGEASFTGQVNGLWLWQNGVGSIIVEQLLERGGARRAA